MTNTLKFKITKKLNFWPIRRSKQRMMLILSYSCYARYWTSNVFLCAKGAKFYILLICCTVCTQIQFYGSYKSITLYSYFFLFYGISTLKWNTIYWQVQNYYSKNRLFERSSLGAKEKIIKIHIDQENIFFRYLELCIKVT